MFDPLRVAKRNLRKLRTTYALLTGAGAAASAIVGVLVLSGVDPAGPVIAAAVLAFGALAMGAGMLLIRARVETAPAIVLLTKHPERVLRVFPKATETVALGASLVSYRWVVIQDDAGNAHELYAGGSDLPAVIAEVRRCAPDAHYDPALQVERLSLRAR